MAALFGCTMACMMCMERRLVHIHLRTKLLASSLQTGAH